MKTLTTWFEVLDFFGGDTELMQELYYLDALKLAEKKNITFTSELYNEAVQNSVMF